MYNYFNCILYSLHGSWIELLKSINQITLCYNSIDFNRIKPECSLYPHMIFFFLYPHRILKAKNVPTIAT